jgi:1-acyl-sn-glycerol-3-phosphate acyltransferase
MPLWRADVHGYFPLPKGPKFIAANHTLASDPFHLPLALDEKPSFMMRHGLFDLPLIGGLLKLAGQIPVKRNSTQSLDCLSPACDTLTGGETIVIFPEGELVPPGKRMRAKTGVVHMALEAGLTIIPLGMCVAPQHVAKFDMRGRDVNAQACGKSLGSVT